MMADKKLKPEWNKYFRYLEKLRQSGETNMYGATPYLQMEFGLEKQEAREVLSFWMKHYEELFKAGVFKRE
jgi:hypothetical protein